MKQLNYRILNQERFPYFGQNEPERVTDFAKHEAYMTLIREVLNSKEENIIVVLTHKRSTQQGATDGVMDCDDFTVTWIPIQTVDKGQSVLSFLEEIGVL